MTLMMTQVVDTSVVGTLSLYDLVYRRTGNHSRTCQNLSLREKFLRFARTV